MNDVDQYRRAERMVTESATAIWDFDGVIADTEPIQAASFAAVLEAHDVAPPEGFFAKFLGRSEREIWLSLGAQYGLRASVDALAAERSELYLERASRLRPAPYVAPLLAAAAGSGVTCLIVSSGTVSHVRRLLDAFRLSGSFAAVYCIGSPSHLDLPSKVARLQHVASTWPKPQVLLEDSSTYLALGIALDMKVIAVVHGMSPIDLAKEHDVCLRH